MASGLDGTRLAAGGKGALCIVYAVQLSATGNATLTPCIELHPYGDVLTLALDEPASLLVTGGDSKVVQLWDVRIDPEVAGDGEAVDLHAATQLEAFYCKAQVHGVSLDRNGRAPCRRHFGTHGDLSADAPWPKPAARELPKPAEAERSVNRPAGRELTRVVSEQSVLKEQPQSRRRGNRVGSSGRDSSYTLTVEPMMILENHVHQGGVAFARHTSMLVVAGGHHVNVTSISTGSSLHALKRSGRVRCVALSASGELLVAGGFDKMVCVHMVGEGADKRVFDILEKRMMYNTGREKSEKSRMRRPRHSIVNPLTGATDGGDESFGESFTKNKGRKRRISFSSGTEPSVSSILSRSRSNSNSGASQNGLRREGTNGLGEASRLSEASTATDREATTLNRVKGGHLHAIMNLDQTNTVVRSVHLSADSMRLVVGADMGDGTGKVVLFDPRQVESCHLREWKHAKAVWAVRLSSDGALLAAAGYDCKVSLYDTRLPASVSGDSEPRP